MVALQTLKTCIKAVHVGERNKYIVSPFIADNLNRDHASFHATLVPDNFCLVEANRASFHKKMP